MIDLTPMKRIELLCEEGLAPRIAKIIRSSGFSGHTVMPVLQGEGAGGRWTDERITGSSRVMILAIGTEADAGKLLEELAPILDSHRLLLTIGDVEVIRQERF